MCYQCRRPVRRGDLGHDAALVPCFQAVVIALPRVSINLCCYNSARYLAETLRSIVSQTYADWELVIVNDGSTDETETIVRGVIAEGWPIVYRYQANEGLGSARNRALELSTGELVAFIDHDDLWLPDKLAKQVVLFDRDPSVGLVFCNTLFFAQDGRFWPHYSKRKPPRGDIFGDLLARYFLSLETVMVRRAALIELDEWFDPSFMMAEEVDLFLRIAHRWKADYVDEPLAKWRIHPDSLTQTRRERFTVEFDEVLDKLSAKIDGFEQRYTVEILAMREMIDRQKAQIAWKNGNVRGCRALLRRHIFHDLKSLMLYGLTALPYRLFEKARLRYHGY